MLPFNLIEIIIVVDSQKEGATSVL